MSKLWHISLPDDFRKVLWKDYKIVKKDTCTGGKTEQIGREETMHNNTDRVRA